MINKMMRLKGFGRKLLAAALCMALLPSGVIYAAEPENTVIEAAGIEAVNAEAANVETANAEAANAEAVNVEAASRVITGFSPLSEAETLYTFEGRPSLSEILAALPSSLTVSFEDGAGTESLPVNWAVCADDYESSDDYYFQFDPVWDEASYTLSRAVDPDTVPWIGVMVESTLSGDGGFDGTMMSADATSYSNEETIFRYLLSPMGLNKAAACGVLANIQAESGFRPGAVGDNGTSFGICQWHASRYTALINYCNSMSLDYQTLEGQLAYLNYELSGTYKNSVLAKLKSASNDANGAYQAGYDFCYNFERPSDKENRSKTRGNSAKNNFYPKYKNYEMNPKKEPETPKEPIVGETFYLPVNGSVKLKELVTEFTPKKWKTSGSKLASVNKNGKVTAKKATGDSYVTITAVSAGSNPDRKTFKIYVEKPVVSGSKTLRTNDGFILPERITGLNMVAPTGYASSNSEVLAIDEETGEVTVLKNGSAKLTTFFEGTKLTTAYKVRLPGIKQNTLKVKEGKTKKLTLQNKHSSVELTFVSEDPDIASVDENGKICGNAEGSTTVELYVNDSFLPYDTCEITVTP
ncbi:MAG: Ig-like domain-containing protein [Lachnospiraceae bacterium]|nr:Ig-like domain-containing protein [Lachnospiraceae bacterium]